MPFLWYFLSSFLSGMIKEANLAVSQAHKAKNLYRVECFDCFMLQRLLLATKEKGDAYKRCTYFFTALMLHKSSARSFTLPEVQISAVTLHLCPLLILEIISSIFLWPFQERNLHAMQVGLKVQKGCGFYWWWKFWAVLMLLSHTNCLFFNFKMQVCPELLPELFCVKNWMEELLWLMLSIIFDTECFWNNLSIRMGHEII